MPDLPRASARYYMRWPAEVVDRVRAMIDQQWRLIMGGLTSQA